MHAPERGESAHDTQWRTGVGNLPGSAPPTRHGDRRRSGQRNNDAGLGALPQLPALAVQAGGIDVVLIEVDLPGGKKVTLGEGAFFGEMALLGNNLRSANITTTRLARLLVLDLVDFRLLMARHPDLAETIDVEAKRRALENK